VFQENRNIARLVGAVPTLAGVVPDNGDFRIGRRQLPPAGTVKVVVMRCARSIGNRDRIAEAPRLRQERKGQAKYRKQSKAHQGR
jgi:hypothetical protein